MSWTTRHISDASCRPGDSEGRHLAAVSVAVAVVGCLTAAVSAPAAIAGTPKPRDASEVSAELIAGRSVLLENGTRIDGTLKLRGKRIRGALVCKKCTITGGIRAAQARFESIVDLGGATVERAVDLENATFLAAARFGSSEMARQSTGLSLGCVREGRAGALFRRNVNLAFATFDDIADFQQATFCDAADFTSVRFRGSTRFGRVDFRSDSRFSAAAFDRETVFADGNFGGRTIDFRGASFVGSADFRRARFGGVTPVGTGVVTFESAVFHERADFGKTNFVYPTRFRDARFGLDGVFRNATFHRPPTSETAVLSFDQATIGGRLDFTSASLEGVTELRWLAAGVLSLQDTTFARDPRLFAHGVRAGELVAEADVFDHVQERRDRVALLKLLEVSATERDDLRLANQAHYELQELAARDDWPPRRIADFAFYRYVAGYLVRPIFPFAWLVGVVIVATALRARRLKGSDTPANSAPASKNPGEEVQAHGAPSSGRGETSNRPADKSAVAPGTPTAGLWQRVLTAFSLTVTGRQETSSLRGAELVIYTVLVSCILVALANTNPTLRDMIDTIR